MAVDVERAALKEAKFIQEKLESYYDQVYETLWPWRDAVLLVQETLTWKKPIISLILYVIVHFVFYHFVTEDAGVMSILLTLCFFVVVGDMLWRLGRPKGRDTKRRNSNIPRLRRNTYQVSLEHAMVDYHQPRLPGELLSFPSVCVLVSSGLLWVDLTFLTLVGKCRDSPTTVAVMALVTGVLIAGIARMVPPIVLAYLIVVGLLCLPYMECYHVWTQIVAKLQPWLVRIDLEAIKKKIFVEEKDEDYEFAIDETMTPEAFAIAVGGRVPKRSSGGVSVMAPISEHPTPDHGTFSQNLDERSMSLDPHYDSLVADLAYGIDDMPSITSDLGMIEEEGSRNEPDLGGPDSSTPPLPTPLKPQARKRRKLPRPPKPGQEEGSVGGGVQSPLTYSSHSSEVVLTSPPLPLGQTEVYQSTPVVSIPPPSYDEVIAKERSEEYADFYRRRPSDS